jgi:hypothetical protein
MISAAQAITRECRFCTNKAQSECITKRCNLHPGVWSGKRSKVRQIRAHCLECAGTPQAVAGCSGNLLRDNGNGGKCWLHPYRFGKNPARKCSEAQKRGFEVMRRRKDERGGDALCAATIDDLGFTHPTLRGGKN